MHKLLVALFLLFSTACAAQGYKDDWKGFSSGQWMLTFRDDTMTKIQGHTSVGHLVFTNKSDSTLTFSYTVFPEKKEEKKDSIYFSLPQIIVFTSCSMNGFSDFNYYRHFYLSQRCGCITSEIKDCELLELQLFKYRYEWHWKW